MKKGRGRAGQGEWYIGMWRGSRRVERGRRGREKGREG